MKYIIKGASWHPFNQEFQVLHDDEQPLYFLKATGSALRRLLLPDFSFRDVSGHEVLRAEREKVFQFHRHVLIHKQMPVGLVREYRPFRYSLKVNDHEEYSIQLSGSTRKWDMKGPNGVVAEILPSTRKWGWRVNVISQENILSIVAGLTIIYKYFQDTGG